MAFTGLTPLLYVAEFDISLGFWRDAMGFAVTQEAGGDGWNWAQLESGPVRLMLNSMPDNLDRATRLPDDFGSVLYLGADDVSAFAQAIRMKGVRVSDPEPQEYGLDQVWLRDPDGYQICVTSPRKG